MELSWQDLTAATDSLPEDLLDEWRWLVPSDLKPIWVTAMGDAFLQDHSGRILFLDVINGNLEPAAFSRDDLETALQKQANRQKWFMPHLVSRLHAREIAAGTCYSYVLPPVVGGDLDASNVVVRNISDHFAGLGQVHHRVRDGEIESVPTAISRSFNPHAPQSLLLHHIGFVSIVFLYLPLVLPAVFLGLWTGFFFSDRNVRTIETAVVLVLGTLVLLAAIAWLMITSRLRRILALPVRVWAFILIGAYIACLVAGATI